MSDLPIAFRNVARYVSDVEKALPLYEALGFKRVRAFPGFAILEASGGARLVLHEWEGINPPITSTALGFTMLNNDVARARQHVEQAGWRLLRAPDEEDEGFFFIYADPDGNTINLVGER
ncbi:MAG TPA: VOC family protein [Candidatus Thermoplasmatota archaeon]|nr:VOC family protein [Candidatus Thermoplasmatota archaeon]